VDYFNLDYLPRLITTFEQFIPQYNTKAVLYSE